MFAAPILPVTWPAAVFALVLAGCNNLPVEGECDEFDAGSIDTPQAELVTLLGAAASFDDLRFAPTLSSMIAIPEGSGTLFLVDVETVGVTRFDGFPKGIASADANEAFVFVVDRGSDSVLVVDREDGSTVASLVLEGSSDYVRVAPNGEVWVTESGQVEVLSFSADPPELTHAALIEVPSGPEGLVFDATRGLAFVQGGGGVVVIDIEERAVVDEWSAGCASSHGIPVVDEERGFVFAGCRDGGGGSVLDLDDGAPLAGYEVGGGEALLAYNPALGHFYLRGDPGTDVAVLGVCDKGHVVLLATLHASEQGHAMAADDRGQLWVADATRGGLIRFDDPYPAAP